MASKRIQKWIEDGEEVKTNLAALIDSPLLVNSESQPELGDTTDGCTAGTSKRARKLTAVMQESQEQQKSDSENRADKPEKAPAKKRKKDDKETDHIDSQKSNKENTGKQAKKGPVKSKADKSKETRKQLSNIANKTTAENEACTKATREIYQTFMAAFPGSTHPKERGNQVSLVEDSEDSDAEEETDGTAGELANVPPSLGEPTVTPPRIQQQMSASISLPHQVQVTPPIATDSRQELLPPIQSGSFTPRSGTTLSLSETAEAFVRAMNSPLNVDSDEDFFPPGGFRDFLARPLGQDMSQESQKELAQLREENSQLRDEIAMLREQLNSSAKNQPGKLQMINIIRNLFVS